LPITDSHAIPRNDKFYAALCVLRARDKPCRQVRFVSFD
jgi:hypothetical protein